MRVGYARVSTIDQNPELQLEALRRAGCEKVFTEKASGARDDRPELARILTDVLRAGDTLVVWKLDRLARSLKKLIATAEELERQKIGLVSLTESIDTTTPGGMLTFHVFGAIAQFERALIRERTTAGLVEARRQGRKGGRPPVMRASDVTAARAMMKEGSLPVRDIAKRIGRVGRDAISLRRQARPTRARDGTRPGAWLTGRSDRPARRWSTFAGACRCCPRAIPAAPRSSAVRRRPMASRSGRCTARCAS